MKIKTIPVINYYDIYDPLVIDWINLYINYKLLDISKVFSYLDINLSNTNLYGLTSDFMEDLYKENFHNSSLEELSNYVENKFKEYGLPIKEKFLIDLSGSL